MYDKNRIEDSLEFVRQIKDFYDSDDALDGFDPLEENDTDELFVNLAYKMESESPQVESATQKSHTMGDAFGSPDANILQEQRRIAQERRRLEQEEARRREAELAEQRKLYEERRRLEQEAAKRRQAELEQQRKLAEERQRLEQEAAKRRQAEQEQQRKLAEERQRLEQEAAKRKQAELEQQRKLAEERQRLEQEAAKRKQAELEQQRKLAEERQRLEQEAAKRKQAELEQQRKLAEERQRLEQERKQAEQEQQRKLAEERQRLEQERKQAEQEQQRKLAEERQRLEQEAAKRRQAEQEQQRKLAEERQRLEQEREQRRQIELQEKQRQEEERKKIEEERRKLAEEQRRQEQARIQLEQERQRLVEERLQKELEEQRRLLAEQARKEAEEKARKEAEEKERRRKLVLEEEKRKQELQKREEERIRQEEAQKQQAEAQKPQPLPQTQQEPVPSDTRDAEILRLQKQAEELKRQAEMATLEARMRQLQLESAGVATGSSVMQQQAGSAVNTAVNPGINIPTAATANTTANNIPMPMLSIPGVQPGAMANNTAQGNTAENKQKLSKEEIDNIFAKELKKAPGSDSSYQQRKLMLQKHAERLKKKREELGDGTPLEIAREKAIQVKDFVVGGTIKLRDFVIDKTTDPENAETREKAQKIFSNVLVVVICIFIAFMASSIFINFVAHPTKVEGESMETTLTDGDTVMIQKLSYYFGSPQRYDVVVFPIYDSETFYIKRVIGLPGETVQITEGKIFINDKELEDDIYGKDEFIDDPGDVAEPITLASDEYFVLGDNRNMSIDSRSSYVGLIKKKNIVGKAWRRVLPFSKSGKVK